MIDIFDNNFEWKPDINILLHLGATLEVSLCLRKFFFKGGEKHSTKPLSEAQANTIMRLWLPKCLQLFVALG